MCKKIIKMIFYSVIVFVCATFFHTSKTLAANSCVCYYQGLGKESIESVGGNNSRTVLKRDVYLVEIKIYNTKHTYTNNDIKYFGEANVKNYTSDYFKTTTELKDKLNENTGSVKFMDGYNTANYTRIVEKNCTKKACDGIAVTFHSFAYSKEIGLGVRASQLTDGVNVDMSAISSDEAKEAQESEFGNEIMESNTDDNKENDINAIQCWANPNLEFCGSSDTTNRTCQFLDGKYYGKDGNVVDEKTYTKECYVSACNLIPSNILDFLKNFLFIIQIIGILLLIMMSFMEFIKAITGSDDDSLRNAIKNTGKRLIVVVILLLLPVIIGGIINIINDNGFEKDDDGHYIIGDDGNPLCNLDK